MSRGSLLPFSTPAWPAHYTANLSFPPAILPSLFLFSSSFYPSVYIPRTLALSTTLHGRRPYNSRSLSVARLYRRSRFDRWCNKRKRTAASIMRATLSQRDQQRLNCIRDSRTAHKFSSQRRGFLLNTRPSAVIRRVFSFHPIFLASLYSSHDFTNYFRNAIIVRYTFYHSLGQSFTNKIDVTHNSRRRDIKKKILLKISFNIFYIDFYHFFCVLIKPFFPVKYNSILSWIISTTYNIALYRYIFFIKRENAATKLYKVCLRDNCGIMFNYGIM